MTPPILDTMLRGARASVTLDNINLSEGFDPSRRTGGPGRIELAGGQAATYEALYRTQPWIQTAVNRISGGIGSLPLDAYINGDLPGEREKQRKGALAELLWQPYEHGTPSSWKQSILMNLLIHGNGIDVKIRPGVGRPPSELLPSSFQYWTCVYGRDNLVDWWVFNAGPGRRVPFRPEEVIHYHRWPGGRGVVAPSPLEALRRTLMLEDAAQRAAISAFEEGGRARGSWVVDGRVHPDDMKKLRAVIDELYGGPDKMYRGLLMDNGIKYQAIPQTTLVDSELVELRKVTREEILAVYNLPQPSAGVLDRATFSNVTEQHLMEYMDTYRPWTTLIEETLAVELIGRRGAPVYEPLMAGQYVEFNYKAVMAGDPVRQQEVITKAVGGPWMTPNEARATQNLPPLEGGDELNPSPTTAGAPASTAA